MKFGNIIISVAAVAGFLLAGCSSVAATQNTKSAAQPASEAMAARRVEAIRTSPKVTAAFQSIVDMNARNIERLIEITEIPAPPFEEQLRAADYVKRLKSLGLGDVSIDKEGNVVARRPGKSGKRTIAIVAHIDTVFPRETDVTVRREGNVYYAPGIGDNSRAMVVMLSLVEVLEKHNIQTEDDILFVGSVGEEGLGDLRGVRYLLREGGSKIDRFIAIDGGSPGRLITRAVGSNRYRVTFNGPGGHSYGAFGRAHPHQALAEAIRNFTEAARPITQDGTKSTFSVGRIGGGTSINSIPFESWMEVDMRSADPAKLAELDVTFQKAVQDALAVENARRTDNDALTADIKSVGRRPAGRTDPDAPLIANVSAALRAVGIEPRQRASSTDSNIPMSIGIPAVTISRGGRTRNAHAPDESWENKDSHISIQAALLAVLAEAGMR